MTRVLTAIGWLGAIWVLNAAVHGHHTHHNPPLVTLAFVGLAAAIAIVATTLGWLDRPNHRRTP